jgi:hypothetical protein
LEFQALSRGPLVSFLWGYFGCLAGVLLTFVMNNVMMFFDSIDKANKSWIDNHFGNFSKIWQTISVMILQLVYNCHLLSKDEKGNLYLSNSTLHLSYSFYLFDDVLFSTCWKLLSKVRFKADFTHAGFIRLKKRMSQRPGVFIY